MSIKSNDSKLKKETSNGFDGKIIEGHNYDGIDELDNQLPRWWVGSFYLTIVVAAGYFLYYMVWDGPTLVQEYERNKRDYEHAQIAQQADQKVTTDEDLRAVMASPSRLDSGSGIFQVRCALCHGPQGQGGIGPNLTDDYWIHGARLTEILKTVKDGVLDKGMPPWGGILKEDELESVVAFVKSLRGTNPPNQKAPEGVLVKE